MTILDEIKAMYGMDISFQRECKKEGYRLRDGLVTDMFASKEDVTVLIPYPNNRLKAEHRPMRRMRHYGRRQNYAR